MRTPILEARSVLTGMLLFFLGPGPLVAAATPPRAPAPDAPLSIEQFFQRPEFTAPKLSADGRYLAFLSRQGEVLNLFTMDLQEKKIKKLTGFDEYDVLGYAWVDEKRLVFYPNHENHLTGQVYAINADGKKSIDLVDQSSDQQRRASSGAGWFDEGELSRRPSKDMLLQFYEPNVSKTQPDLYRVNTQTGKRTLVLRNREEFDGWVTDNQGRVRIVYKLSGTTGTLLHRVDEGAPWQVLREIDEKTLSFQILCFDQDDMTVWVLSDHEGGRAALFKLDLRTGQLSDCIARQEKVDISGVIRNRWSGEVEGYTYETDKSYSHWFDPEMQKLITRVEQTFPGFRCSVASRSADKNLLVLQVWGDREPGRYYLFDRKVGNLETIGVQRPEVDPARMAMMEVFRIKARDGLELEGYLTRPPGSEGRQLPLIMHPHGGPWARDSWGYDPEVQFLASRGYAVLQVNFRGSTGYGRDFMLAGMRQWGLKMQDDITDAVQWSIAQGIADPQRIAIYGASYGGFAAMAGLVFTPDLYRCGVNYVGVTNVALLTTSRPVEERYLRAYRAFMVGDPKADAEYIKKVSPVNHIAALKAPVFLAYGFRDPRVDIKHANELISELKRLKKPYEVIIKDNEGHGYIRRKNVVELYTKMEAFFAKHLGPGPVVQANTAPPSNSSPR